jgi:hypothetical protein
MRGAAASIRTKRASGVPNRRRRAKWNEVTAFSFVNHLTLFIVHLFRKEARRGARCRGGPFFSGGLARRKKFRGRLVNLISQRAAWGVDRGSH